jgi:hypothetical protein
MCPQANHRRNLQLSNTYGLPAHQAPWHPWADRSTFEGCGPFFRALPPGAELERQVMDEATHAEPRAISRVPA